MLTLKGEIRKILGKKAKSIKKTGSLPGVLYGPEIKNMPIGIDLKEFKKVFAQTGASSLISLEIGKDKFLTLVHDIKNDPLTNEPTHVDFYQPKLTEEIEVMVPIVFEGEAKAVKDLGGTLIKDLQEIKVKALPQNLPHEIKVSVAGLNTFEDEVKIKDLQLPNGVKILRDVEEILAKVMPPEKVEEELEKPIEEKVDEVEKVEKEKKDKGEEVEPEVAKPAAQKPEQNKQTKETK